MPQDNNTTICILRSLNTISFLLIYCLLYIHTNNNSEQGEHAIEAKLSTIDNTFLSHVCASKCSNNKKRAHHNAILEAALIFYSHSPLYLFIFLLSLIIGSVAASAHRRNHAISD